MISVLDAEKTCWLGVNAEEDGAPPVPTIVVAPETFGITRAGLPSAPMGAAEAWACKERKMPIVILIDTLLEGGGHNSLQFDESIPSVFAAMFRLLRPKAIAFYFKFF